MYSKLLKKSKYPLKVVLTIFIIHSIIFTMLSFVSGFFLIFLLIFILLSLYFALLLKFSKYSKMEKLKNKIETSFNFTKFDVEEDFNNAINIDRIWIGNKFIILLAEKEADLIINENLAWAFVFKKILPINQNQLNTYYLFTIDFDGNKNITFVPSINNKNNKILEIIEEKCPNALVGYNDKLLEYISENSLLNLPTEYINNLKNLDNSNIDIKYFLYFGRRRSKKSYTIS